MSFQKKKTFRKTHFSPPFRSYAFWKSILITFATTRRLTPVTKFAMWYPWTPNRSGDGHGRTSHALDEDLVYLWGSPNFCVLAVTLWEYDEFGKTIRDTWYMFKILMRPTQVLNFFIFIDIMGRFKKRGSDSSIYHTNLTWFDAKSYCNFYVYL
jgi:hypothetical protein